MIKHVFFRAMARRRNAGRRFASLAVVVVTAVALVLASPARPAFAQGMSLIRDAEIETTIRGWAAPLLRAAGVAPESVSISLVRDESLNAFVTLGNKLYLHTGLLKRSENASQVIGVLAHEIGHIAGGHAVRLKDEMETAQMLSMIAAALGMAAAAGTGRGDVGAAVIMGGGQAALKNLFSFTRTQESAADQAALKYLNATGQSAAGLLQFFEILGDQELLLTSQQDPYVRTHPLTTERIATVRNAVEQSVYPEVRETAADQVAHDRMVAKLFAFLETPGRTFQRYPETDESVPARYAHAIAYYRQGKLAQAVPIIDGLIEQYPQDPYFHELKGQMLLENSRVADSIGSYRRAVDLRPDAPLIRISLAHALIETQDDTLLPEAQSHLTEALKTERGNGFAWRLLGTTYGRENDMTMASYAMSESALLQGDPSQALFHASRAEQGLKVGDPTWLKVQDVKQRAQNLMEEMKRRGG
ncbi:Putative Zn-dependent protease, contains TPR repeats [Caenispirillum bisanense]|uniref:Zn-dependent protease, contains TPR repeats n=2 Tax=Caenispirillum bisanense TaxID=414052 RepID=A0A286GRA7_9PROT|nr:Putative Zn-dependent protease, contains TPR repeats [Caenispirillum bisanense]